MSLHIARPSKVNWQIFLGSATVTVLTFCQRKATTPSNGSNGVNVCKCESSSWLHANTLCNPWIQNQLVSRDLQNNLYGGTQSSAPLILASSPQYANTDSQVHKRRWWAFFWRSNKSRNNSRNKTSWIQKIGKTIFVITRGLEIVVRISPLLILTPTALIVSSVDSLFRRVWHPKKHIISTSGGTEEDNNLFIQQLQEFDAAVRNVHHGQTWASNLAWRYTLYTLQSLGPAFSKLGQWAATRRDLFPVQMCNRLSELHDMANTHSLEYTHIALEEAFGDYKSKGLTLTNDIILGSGSAAQVHLGSLTFDGASTKSVAIKVLHPNTRMLVERDLALMQHIADFIDQFIPLQLIRMLSLPRAVANFSDIMRRQVDLRIEGNNLQKFRSNFGCIETNEKYSAIEFPRPATFVSEHVLVEDYIDAKPISLYLADDSPKGLEVKKKLAGPLLRAFFKMVFIDNFVHADLHPGNVLVRETAKDKLSIVFLDAGIAMSLNPIDRQNLHDLFKAVVLNDGYTAGSLMVERARFERCSSIPGGKHAFATGIGDIVSEFHDRSKQGLTLGAVRVGTLLGRVLDLCRKYGVEIDPSMSSVVVSMLVLEGLGRSLDPDLNLMKAALPFLIGRGKV